MFRALASLSVATLLASGRAEPPGAAYIFPAGAQRGTKTEIRVGGFYFHGSAALSFEGSGILASPTVKETTTIWFEGPLLSEPASQQKEDYPKDYLGEVRVDAGATLGVRYWHCHTSQGTTAAMRFVVGDLPEFVEKEVEGAAIPQTVQLPVTINGRIFPREDLDLWRVHAEAGQTVVCSVAARRLGYPLQVVLEVRGADGKAVGTTRANAPIGSDESVSFIAEQAGDYDVAIHDAGFAGGQNFVYRLTVCSTPRIESFFPLGGRRGESVELEVTTTSKEQRTVPISLKDAVGESLTAPVQLDGKAAGAAVLHLDDLPELRESEPDETPGAGAKAVTLPAILNGRIGTGGDVDAWPIDLEKGQMVLFEVLAEDLGSKLDSLLTVHDSEDKEVGRNDDRAEGRADSRLLFTAANAGRFVVKVADRFASRGGAAFAYRLRATPQAGPDFALTVAADFINVIRESAPVPGPEPDAKKKEPPKAPGLKVELAPVGDFAKDVTLEIAGLPGGVTASGTTIAAKQKFTEVRFTAPPNTPIQVARLSIRGTAEVNGQKVSRLATATRAFGEPPGEAVRLAVVPPVPFKHVSEYLVTNDQPGGTTAAKHFRLERGGFEGPLTVTLADRQLRYLGGVTGPAIAVAPGQTEFDYPIIYPVEIEQGHTSRAQLMVVGEMTDFDGSRHRISYTSAEQNDQVIAITTAPRIKVTTSETSYPAPSAGRIRVPVTVERDPTLAGRPIRLELDVPAHMTGVKAAAVDLPSDSETAVIEIVFAEAPGVVNAPVTIVARTNDPPCVGAAKIELVPVHQTPRGKFAPAP